jgi:CBS domain containing-hemolysin-like protein
MQRLGHVPAGGEAIEIDAHRMSIKSMAGRRIGRVRIETVRTPEVA